MFEPLNNFSRRCADECAEYTLCGKYYTEESSILRHQARSAPISQNSMEAKECKCANCTNKYAGAPSRLPIFFGILFIVMLLVDFVVRPPRAKHAH